MDPSRDPTSIDEVVGHNAKYSASFDPGEAPGRPGRRLAVVTCMDARIDVYRVLGLAPGEAHVIRNAGGVVTDDVVRSLVISQRLMGTDAVMVVGHTGCGMLTFSDDELRAEIQAEVGIRPPLAFEAFTDLDDEVLQSLARLAACPFLTASEVRGFVYDVGTGALREIPSAAFQTERGTP